jgi:2-methylisocitrate lyase-like PEP mutase family enzyme
LIIIPSGAATTASRLGGPDLAIATMNDFVEVSVITHKVKWRLTGGSSQAGQMVSSLDPRTPVIADADTGYVKVIQNLT